MFLLNHFLRQILCEGICVWPGSNDFLLLFLDLLWIELHDISHERFRILITFKIINLFFDEARHAVSIDVRSRYVGETEHILRFLHDF